MSDSHETGHSVTHLLARWSAGDHDALNELMPLLYPELHRLASRHMAGQGADHPLQTTALIHEAYVRLAGSKEQDWENRGHFLCAASRVMRHVLVDYARNSQALKRGGDLRIVPIEDGLDAADGYRQDIISLNDGLDTLAAQWPRHAEVMELRYFGGLTVEEIAQVLKVSGETVGRHCRFARSFLRRELSR